MNYKDKLKISNLVEFYEFSQRLNALQFKAKNENRCFYK